MVKVILVEEKDAEVVVCDNFSSGRMRHLAEVKGNKSLKIIKADVSDLKKLTSLMKNTDIVYHLASNPDIARAVIQPDIDFWEGTYLTSNILEAMRKNNIKKLLYASGSGIYGDSGFTEVDEDYSPMLPISTYGASKLACESLISAYCHMFDINAGVFRFANVVGPNQTHGVGLDFIKKLMKDNRKLSILGDGNQSKSYLYITDAVSAMRLVEKNHLRGFSYYNVATSDYLTVRQIADIVLEAMHLKNLKYNYSGDDRGWKGDVPIVRLNSEKIRKLGWKNKYTSREAMSDSIKAMYEGMEIHSLKSA